MLFDLTTMERKVFSQNGEDGCLETIFNTIGVVNKKLIEISANDGQECCSRYLREVHSWSGLVVGRGPGLVDTWVTRDNVVQLLVEHKVPKEPDLLIVDIDGNDYHVLKAILEGGYAPRVLCVEYNPYLGDSACTTIVYDPEFKWDYRDRIAYFGASLFALTKLAASFGYTLFGCESVGVNAFFLRTDVAVKAAYRIFRYNPVVVNNPPGNWEIVR